ncbi:hypothetical protein NP233_g6479 [Leucocoprinus birnbaumii]|uniref:Allergen n=1 Tax=Leucocoprinus birnbaumii TaxID=56174 RepID=A0AAD5VS01_9AGAR|nr:hypothetical protein NP233_g6479 [Leucocoprinus birnbaumii]
MAGITSALKNLTNPSGPAESEAKDVVSEGVDYGKERYGDSSSAPRRSATTGSQKLPPGTGPGTSGKPTSESAMEYDRERTREQGTIAGHGTDSAAAHGGGLADTHRESVKPIGERLQGSERLAADRDRDRDRERYASERSTGLGSGARTADRGATTAVSSSVPGQAAPVVSGRGVGTTVDRDRLVSRGSERSSSISRRSDVLEEAHQRGHSKFSARDTMPSGATQEDTNQLNPITHERIRHLETEELNRVREVDRHIHHIQHHIQPVIASETLTEQVKDYTHLERERTIIDKGVTVKEHTHHHVHHVIQPIIEKETIDRQRIRTTVPIHEITHEAPIIHQSQTHNAVPIEHFLQKGGILQNAVPTDDIGSRVLHSGQCTREIDGVADNLRDLDLTNTYGEREPIGATTTTTTARPLNYRDEKMLEKQKSLRAPDTQVDEPHRMVPMAHD